MNSKTEKSNYPYHHVMIGKGNVDFVTVCINNGNGFGGYDHWRIDKTGHSRVSGLIGDHYMQDYWVDCVDLKVIQNVYKVLDFYVKLEDNVTEIYEVDRGFSADDIPF